MTGRRVFVSLFAVACATLTWAQEPGLELVRAGIGPTVVDRLIGDFDDDGRQDLLLGSLHPDRRWHFLSQAADARSFELRHDLAIPADVAALALARVSTKAGLDLIALSHGGAALLAGPLDPGGRLEPWVREDLIFASASREMPRFWTWGRDLDGDGRDDVLLPGLESDLVAYGGGEKGAPKAVAKVAARASRRARRDGAGMLVVSRSRPRVEFGIFRKDALPEPALYEDGVGLSLLPRRESGGFGGTPQLLFETPSTSTGGTAGLLERNVAKLADLNGDGLHDLVLALTRAQSGQLGDLRTELRFYVNDGTRRASPSHALLLSGVLSVGPEILDANADGVPDLFVSTFAGGVQSEVARRLFRRVKVEYHLYLGTGQDPPFDRAPSLSLEDVMDLEHFENWRFHHRLFLNADWNGDGRADLVRIAQSKRGLRVSLTLASGPETAYAVGSEPAVALDVEEPVLGFEATSLGPDRPAIHLHVEHGSVFVVPK